MPNTYPMAREYVRDGHTFRWDQHRHIVTVTDTAAVDVGHFYTSPGDTFPDMLDMADEWLDDNEHDEPAPPRYGPIRTR